MQIIDALKTLHQKIASKAATSGSIAGVISELAQNWPASSGGAVTIDASLSKTGQAADAKAVGDALAGKVANTAAATTATLWLVKQAASVAAATSETPTKAEFDGLITALKNAGIMANQ